MSVRGAPPAAPGRLTPSIVWGLASAWAAAIWILSPVLPLVRARLQNSSGYGFEGVVALGLGLSAVLFVALAVVKSLRTWKKRLGPLVGLTVLAGLAASALAPPDPRSRLVELSHFVEFGVLGALVFLAHRDRLTPVHRVARTLLVVLAVGLVDETIQHALASRYGEIRDVTLNVAAGALGIGYAWILWTPAGGSPSGSQTVSWTRTLALSLVLVFGLGLFLQAVHSAHAIRFGSVEFVSKFPRIELDEVREERRARWRELSPTEREHLLRPDRTFLVPVDLYATEARFHLQSRNEAEARGDMEMVVYQNEILERWYDPFLDAASARRPDLPRSSGGAYRSATMAHLWPWLTAARLWSAVALLAFTLAGGILWRMRNREAMVLGLAAFFLGPPGAVRSASAQTFQMDEAKMADQLDQLGAMLGLPAVSPEELKTRVAALGGLEFQGDVPVNFMSREELGRYIRDLFDAEYTTEYAEREETMLRGFGFLTVEQDLRTLRENVLNENVAGFYDERPGVKKLFAISSGRSLNVLNQLILSHELRHALQDQHVVIREKLEVESDYDDRRLAALCLFEGDASVLMEQYLAAGATQNRPELAQLFDVFSKSLSGEEIAAMFAGPALKQAPPIVQEQLIAPYFEGRRLAMAVYQRGGFALLNEKLRRPPRSMEQVLHPEKYFSGTDEPIEVSLPEAAGTKPVFEGTLGEFLIRVLLRGGGSSESAEPAAAGWGGDRYVIVADGASSKYRLWWRSIWDSELDAREFATALRTYVQTRFAAENNRVELDGREVFFERRQFQ